jgi:hypothetical protein
MDSNNIILYDILCCDCFIEMFKYFNLNDIMNLLLACRSKRVTNVIYKNFMPSIELNLTYSFYIKYHKTQDDLRFYNIEELIKFSHKWEKGLNSLCIKHIISDFFLLYENFNTILNNVKILNLEIFNIEKNTPFFNFDNDRKLIINNNCLNKLTLENITFDVDFLTKFKKIEYLKLINFTIINFYDIKLYNITTLEIKQENINLNREFIKYFPNLQNLILRGKLPRLHHEIPESIKSLSIFDYTNHINFYNICEDQYEKLRNNITFLYIKNNILFTLYDFTIFNNIKILKCDFIKITFNKIKIPICLKQFYINIDNRNINSNNYIYKIPHKVIKDFCKNIIKFQNPNLEKIQVSYYKKVDKQVITKIYNHI